MKKQLKTISVIKKTNWNPDNDLTISTGITERPIGMFWEAPTGDSLWIGPFMKLGSIEASRRTMNRLEIFPWIQWCASRGHSRSSYGVKKGHLGTKIGQIGQDMHIIRLEILLWIQLFAFRSQPRSSKGLKNLYFIREKLASKTVLRAKFWPPASKPQTKIC